jgi:hypothetical protein
VTFFRNTGGALADLAALADIRRARRHIAQKLAARALRSPISPL